MHGLIRRQNLDGSNIEIVARGVRNSVGFDWHPQTKELWFTDNGRDWIGNDGPQEELNRVAKGNEGAHYGFPYCHANGSPDPTVKRPNACAGVVLPAALLGPHAAALGMRFYTGSMFPASYKNTAFIARRGSWNRDQKFGYDVVQAKIDGGKATITPFMTGFLDTTGQRVLGPAGRRAAAARRLAAGLRRAQRRDLPRHLRQREDRRQVTARRCPAAFDGGDRELFGSRSPQHFDRCRKRSAAGADAGGEAAAVRHLPWRGRQLQDGEHALARRPARAVHHQSADPDARGRAQVRGHGAVRQGAEGRRDHRARRPLRQAGARARARRRWTPSWSRAAPSSP